MGKNTGTHNQIALNVLLDVNVIIDGLQDKPKVRSLTDLYIAMPILTEIAAAANVRLIDSDHILDLTETKLVELLSYTAEEAATVVNLIAEVSAATAGTWVDRPTGTIAARSIEKRLTTRFVGTGKGQVDHEDLQVLGAAYYPIADMDAQEVSLLVTRDGGIHNISQEVAPARIHVAHTRDAIQVVRAMARHN